MNRLLLTSKLELFISLRPEVLMIFIFLILGFLLPIATFLIVFNLLDASTLLKIQVLATTSLATLAMLQFSLHQRFLEMARWKIYYDRSI